MKYLLVGAGVLYLAAAVHAQSVTVGEGGDYPNLSTAIAATSASAVTPDIITFVSEGPFLEPGRIIINNDYALDQIADEESTPLTIKALPGLRPKVVIPTTAASSMYLRKIGELSISDLIIMPGTTSNPSQHAIQVDDHGGFGTSVTLSNLLITSNDGNNQPVASLDGLRPPVYSENTVSFRQDGIHLLSMDTTQLQRVHIYDTVISCIPGAPNADPCGIRGFADGIPGSEWLVGPGCVISYLNTEDAAPVAFNKYAAAAFQPGDNRNMPLKVRGSQEKPVLVFNNNLNGIGITNGNTIEDGVAEMEWVIFANNSGVGYTSGDQYGQNTTFKNVTFVNNGGAFLGSPFADENMLTFSNVIFAGNGDPASADNAITLTPESPGFPSEFTVSNSAIVLNGPFTLNNTLYDNDGVNSDGNWVVSLSGIINDDPNFLSLDPEHGGFGAIGNQAFATAGPNGEPLVGGGRLATSSVSDWQLF